MIFTTIVVFDSVIAKFSSYGDAELSPTENTYIFMILYVGFAATGIVLLNSVNKNREQSRYKSTRSMRLLHGAILAIQFLNIGIILFGFCK